MMQTRLSVYNNSWYKPGGIIKRSLWLIVNALFFNNQLAVFNFLKGPLLRLFGAQVGSGVFIKPSVNIKYPWFLTIGNHVWIGDYVWIDNLTHVTIGSNVCISQGAFLLTGNHNYRLATFDLVIKEIIIEDGVWIGAKTIVCPGVHCGSHSVLTAGSVVSHNMEAYSIYTGIPASKSRDRLIVSFI